MWKPLLQTEFQQNSINLVLCHPKNILTKKFQLASILPENCKSKYTSYITSGSLIQFFNICIAVCSTDKSKCIHKK